MNCKQLILKELDLWREEITSKGCENNEETEILNYELKEKLKQFSNKIRP